MEQQTLGELFKLFLAENGDLLSLIGAAAWGPSLFELWLRLKEKLAIRNRKIDISTIDVYSKIKEIDNEKSGFILLLMVNMFIPEKSFFIEKAIANIRFCGNHHKKIKLIESSIISVTKKMDIPILIPNEYNFNMHREIICERDNIRIIAFEIDEIVNSNIGNIEELELVFEGSEGKKKVVITGEELREHENTNVLLKTQIQEILNFT